MTTRTKTTETPNAAETKRKGGKGRKWKRMTRKRKKAP